MREVIHRIKPDVICLQEVQGYHDRHKSHFPDRLNFCQMKFLAEGLWPHFAYGKNAVYPAGHHGNAILSRYPILSWENQDISWNEVERRGLLHALIRVPDHKEPLHVVSTHLGLFETDRKKQAQTLCSRIESMVPDSHPLLIAGDFNDWRQRTTTLLKQRVGLNEAFLTYQGSHAATFPAWLPVLKLDRVYFRGLNLKKAACLKGAPWNRMSDHLALLSEFTL